MRNIDKYKSDLSFLIEKGEKLDTSMKYRLYPEEVKKQIKDAFKDDKQVEEYIGKIPSFNKEYQSWYSESLVLIKQLLPDRLSDFINLFEKPETRKSIEYGNYVIQDYLQNLTVTSYGEKRLVQKLL